MPCDDIVYESASNQRTDWKLPAVGAGTPRRLRGRRRDFASSVLVIAMVSQMLRIAAAAAIACLLATAPPPASAAKPVQVSMIGPDAAGRGVVPKQATMAVTATGRQLVAWMEESNQEGPVVWGRILDENGTPAGEPFTVSGGNGPAVAARGRRDEFLVAWTELGSELGPQYRVVARRFNRDGKTIGDEFVVAEAAQEPALAYSGKRKEFMIVWREFPFRSSRIYGASLVAGSSTPSAPFLISRNPPADVHYDSPEIAYDSRAGGYLVVWERFSTETGESRAFMRTLPAEPDRRLGRQRTIDETGVSPRVTYNRHAREYLIFWGAPGSPVRRVRTNGRPYGTAVSTTRGTDFERAGSSDIAAAPDGHYEILFWGDQLEETPGYSAVFRRRLGAELKLGRRLRRVSSADPRVSALGGGSIAYSRAGDRFRAVWVEGRQQRDPGQFPGDPPSNWEVWARAL